MTTLAPPPPMLPSYTSFAQPDRLDAEHQHHTLSKASQSVRGASGSSRFADGLPTPPEAKAMTDVYFHNGQPSHFTDRSFYQLPYSTHPENKTNSASWNPQMNDKADGLALGPDTSRAPHVVKDISYEPAPKPNNESIASFLRIPEAIDRKGGSLTELAAEMTCLFWFESATTLQNIEQSPVDAPYTKILAPDTTPTMGFRKWVTTILATTQVTRNVIILALLFIYRLKKSNPQVSGKQGSEFRLLTIALMLGNKFLDDNTYTNKTWAEVSGISVSEIHVMEVEFLSNMRYNLYVSSEEWEDWMVKLGKFRAFLIESSRVSVQRTMALNSPTALGLPQHKLPSPPSPLHNEVHNYSAPVLNPNSIAMPRSQRSSPVRAFPETILGLRKRSLDVSNEEPPAKRGMQSLPTSTFSSGAATPASGLPAIYTPASSAIYTPASSAAYTPASSAAFTPLSETSSNISNHTSFSASSIPRLPMPRIQTNLDPVTASITPWNNQLPLPNGRAMSSVYSRNSSWAQPTTPTSTIPSNSLNPYQSTAPSLPDSSQAGTPFSVRSVHGSPVNHNYHTLTPTTHLSPSIFLNNRNSPYRPIRAVGTLLYPAPSTSLQNPSRNIAFDQMHYQPLSKQSAERKVGVVPYLHQDPWNVPYPAHPNTNST